MKTLKFTTFQSRSFKLINENIKIYNFQLVILNLYNLKFQLFKINVLNLQYFNVKVLNFTF
jgi:hypothetical protein